MKLLSIVALVLGMGAVANAGDRCGYHALANSKIEKAKKSYEATVQLAQQALNKATADVWAKAFEDQKAAGAIEPADEANLAALGVVIKAEASEAELTAQANKTIADAYASYNRTYMNNTIPCNPLQK